MFYRNSVASKRKRCTILRFFLSGRVILTNQTNNANVSASVEIKMIIALGFYKVYCLSRFMSIRSAFQSAIEK